MCPRPRPEPRGGGPGQGRVTWRPAPPQARPRPALAGDSGSRACLCCGAGARVCPVTAPRETHPPESSRPGFHSAPSKPCPLRPTAPPGGGTASLCARARGASFPSPQPWPPRLRRLRRCRSEQRGGRMDGAAGPGEYGAGRAAWPGFRERQPDGRCQCWTAV